MKELEQIKAIFLADDIDDETRADNLEKIRSWETDLINSQNFLGWQEHDITKQISRQAKDAYKTLAIRLANDRELTELQRQSLWSKQDACIFLLSLIEKDAKNAMDSLQREIKAALNAI